MNRSHNRPERRLHPRPINPFYHTQITPRQYTYTYPQNQYQPPVIVTTPTVKPKNTLLYLIIGILVFVVIILALQGSK